MNVGIMPVAIAMTTCFVGGAVTGANHVDR